MSFRHQNKLELNVISILPYNGHDYKENDIVEIEYQGISKIEKYTGRIKRITEHTQSLDLDSSENFKSKVIIINVEYILDIKLIK